MCGIYGIWHTDGAPVDVAALRRQTERIRHRGPDDEGYLLADTASGATTPYGGPDSAAALCLAPLGSIQATGDLAFGFRRLAILDLSPAGHQPMSDPSGRLWIVFNGEIYNYRALRAELESAGHSFRSGSDTEVILAAYAEWGQGCLQRLNGMFAFAIWDARRRELLIARDRFGIKPLYYIWNGRTLAFASEIKALAGRDATPFAPDDRQVYRFLVSGLLPNPQSGETFFGGVRSLPPARWLRLSNGKLAEGQYWRLDIHQTAEQSAADAAEEYGALFADAVRLQLQSDVPVGTCLSGGLDSSSIVCTINRLMAAGGAPTNQLGEHQKTFSAVYTTEGRYNERAYVEQLVAATSAEKNLTFPSAERLWADAERLVWHQDEPFQSTSIFAQWCVMSAVRERGVTVLLDGQGADETLAGYRRRSSIGRPKQPRPARQHGGHYGWRRRAHFCRWRCSGLR